MIIAAKNKDKSEIANEVSDLLFHILVMLQACDVPMCWIFCMSAAKKQGI